MRFKPNFDLYDEWEDAEKVFKDGRRTYIAVFKKDEKTLLYIADAHGMNESFDMVDFCFSENSPAKPEIAVVENAGRKPAGFQSNGMIYAVAVAAKLGLPVVFGDLSESEMLDVLRLHAPGKDLKEDDLHKVLTSGGPSRKKGPYNLMAADLNKYGRDPFMVKNIAAALDKYNVVLAMFGEGHYRSQRLILEDMLGQPEYITKVPNSRGDFDDIEIKPVTLVQGE